MTSCYNLVTAMPQPTKVVMVTCICRDALSSLNLMPKSYKIRNLIGFYGALLYPNKFLCTESEFLRATSTYQRCFDSFYFDEIEVRGTKLTYETKKQNHPALR